MSVVIPGLGKALLPSFGGFTTYLINRESYSGLLFKWELLYRGVVYNSGDPNTGHVRTLGDRCLFGCKNGLVFKWVLEYQTCSDFVCLVFNSGIREKEGKGKKHHFSGVHTVTPTYTQIS